MENEKHERKTPSSRASSRKIREISPYSKNFKCYIKCDERDLVHRRQMVTKLSRKDLEDKYIELCDENFFLKRQNNESEEKIKVLTTKIIRLSEYQRSYSSSGILKENTIRRKIAGRSEPGSSRIQNDKIISRASSLNTIFKRSIKNLSTSNSNIIANSARVEEIREVKIDSEIEKGIQEPSEKSQNQEKDLLDLKETIDSIRKKLEHEKGHSEQLEKEKRTLEHRLSEVDLKKFLIENIEVNRLKRKLEHCREIVYKLREHNHKIAHSKSLQIQAIKVENYELTKRLNDEITKNSALSDKLDELNSALRTVETLKKQINELEFDKKVLFEQQENLRSTLVMETSSSYKQVRNESSLSIDIQELLEKVEHLETENAAIDNSKNKLLNKIRQLQDFNDKLMVDLEGLKAERNFQIEMTDISEQDM